MEAGKFFVNIGLTGVEKMAGGLEQINDHFAGLKGISTEAKLAILAALAGLEQMVSFSGKFGNELTKTTQFLNENVETIQTWETAAQRAGAAAGDMTGALQKIQDTMNDIWAGKGPPEFLPAIMSMLSNAGEKFTPEELAGQANYWQKHPLDFFRHIVDATHLKGVDKGRLGYMLSQLGIPQDILSVARLGAFDPSKINQARQLTLSQGDVNTLNNVNVEWKTFEQTMGHIVKMFSTELLPVLERMNTLAKGLDDYINFKVKTDRRVQEALSDRHINELIFGKERMKELSTFRIRPGHKEEDLQRLFNLVFNIQGVDLKDHPALKKAINEAVKPAIRELNRKERTGAISTATPTVSR